MKTEVIDKSTFRQEVEFGTRGTFQETAVFLVEVLYKHYTDQKVYGTKPLSVLEEGFIETEI